jgi:hypothetical protein
VPQKIESTVHEHGSGNSSVMNWGHLKVFRQQLLSLPLSPLHNKTYSCHVDSEFTMYTNV